MLCVPLQRQQDSDAASSYKEYLVSMVTLGKNLMSLRDRTVGAVSATHRYHGNYSDAIQTDAPVNPGTPGAT